MGDIRFQSFKSWLVISADFAYKALGFDTREGYLDHVDKLEAEFNELKPHGDHYIAYGQKPLN